MGGTRWLDGLCKREIVAHRGSEKRVTNSIGMARCMLEEFVKNELVELYELLSIRAVSEHSVY
jgi:hypothetical protein